MLEKDIVIKIKDIVINILKSDQVNPAWVDYNPKIYSVNLISLFFFLFKSELSNWRILRTVAEIL